VSCEEIRAGYLAGDRSSRITAHLRGCSECRRLLPQLDRMRDHLDDPGTWEAPSADLGEQVLDAIRGASAAGAATPPADRRGWRWLAGGAAIAAALVAVVVGVVQTSRSDGADWRIALQPTEVVPDAEATVEGWNRPEGTELLVDVTGLPPSGPDAHYAIWLTSTDGRHIPAGTFTSSGTIVTWAGVRRADFPRVWITLEPNDDDESLSGTTVFDTVT
jgi:hypothetical protein